MTHLSKAIVNKIFDFINGEYESTFRLDLAWHKIACSYYMDTTWDHEVRRRRAEQEVKNFLLKFINRVSLKNRGQRSIRNTVCYWIWEYNIVDISFWPSRDK